MTHEHRQRGAVTPVFYEYKIRHSKIFDSILILKKVENLPGATFFRKLSAAPPFLPSKNWTEGSPRVELFVRNSKTVLYKQRLIRAHFR